MTMEVPHKLCVEYKLVISHCKLYSQKGYNAVRCSDEKDHALSQTTRGISFFFSLHFLLLMMDHYGNIQVRPNLMNLNLIKPKPCPDFGKCDGL